MEENKPLKIIVIDDEPLLLQDCADLIAENFTVEITGKYEDPLAALDAVKHGLPVEVAFLDIHMPRMNGLELAEKLLETRPDLEIVFLTAYDEYALQAFEAGAFDYILKPLRVERLQKTMQRLRTGAVPSATVRKPLSVNFFDRFRCFADDQPIKWRGKAVEEAAAYFLVHRNKAVHKEALCEILWPDAPGKTALANLQVVMCRVRQAFAQVAKLKIGYIADCYTLSSAEILCDIDEFMSFTGWKRALDANEQHRLRELYGEGYLAGNGWLWAYEQAAYYDGIYYRLIGENN